MSGTSSLARLSPSPTCRLSDGQVYGVDLRRGDTTVGASADPAALVFASGDALGLRLRLSLSVYASLFFSVSGSGVTQPLRPGSSARKPCITRSTFGVSLYVYDLEVQVFWLKIPTSVFVKCADGSRCANQKRVCDLYSYGNEHETKTGVRGFDNYLCNRRHSDGTGVPTIELT